MKLLKLIAGITMFVGSFWLCAWLIEVVGVGFWRETTPELEWWAIPWWATVTVIWLLLVFGGIITSACSHLE